MLQWYKCFVAFEYAHYAEFHNKCHKFGSSDVHKIIIYCQKYGLPVDSMCLRFRLEFNTSLRRQTRSVNLATNFQINTLSSPVYPCELWEIRPYLPVRTPLPVYIDIGFEFASQRAQKLSSFFFMQKRNAVPKPKSSGQLKARCDSISSSLHVNGLVLMRGREAKLSAAASRTIKLRGLTIFAFCFNVVIHFRTAAINSSY